VSTAGDWRGALSGFAAADSFQGFISLERTASGGGLCNATGTVSGSASQSAVQLTGATMTAVGSCTGDLPTGLVVTLRR
jgi:hypothetical protein